MSRLSPAAASALKKPAPQLSSFITFGPRLSLGMHKQSTIRWLRLRGDEIRPRSSVSKSPDRQAVYIHESSFIDEPCEIGEGTKIWHFSHILKNSRIGRRCVIGQNVVIGPNVTIGDNVKIQNNVSIYDGVTLEDDVFCGPSMVFTNVINPRAHVSRKEEFRPTLVRRGASLGANCTIVCGITIGEYAFIGAGAVVTKSVPSFALVIGNPARFHGWMCRCGEKLDAREGTVTCKCGDVYEISTNHCSLQKVTA
jgi:UDP-2-acetamido-3-amino-2,3-dideoxy-glucuronate N-acetyltransferase